MVVQDVAAEAWCERADDGTRWRPSASRARDLDLRAPGRRRTFYTSLGHPDDFGDVDFQRMLVRGIYWAVGQTVPDMKR